MRSFGFLRSVVLSSIPLLAACGGSGDASFDEAGAAGGGGSAATSGSAGSSAGKGGSSGAGASGTAGASGKGGSAGASGGGSAGASGAGAGGVSGSSGGAGKAGASGAAGAAGTAGTAGTAGASGASGKAGASGTGGASGTSGASGTGGKAGASGTAGAGGASCTSGILCGPQGTCCAVGNECFQAACVPACPSGVRCGAASDVCCKAGDVCVANACTTPGTSCSDSFDCPEDAVCEPTIGKCLPQKPPIACEYKPPVGALSPTLEWSWTTSTIKPTFHQVINTPLVVDLDKDGVPDVVIVTSDNFDGAGNAYLRALDGKTGLEKWTAQADVYLDANRVNPRATPAVGDIDGDGFPEIVTAKSGGGVIAFEHDGKLKWKATQADGTTAFTKSFNSVTTALADLEGDGSVEIVLGGIVFDKTGKLRFDKGEYAGSNDGTYGAVSIVADVDQDGKQEILTGRRAFRSDGSVMWDNAQIDGYPAIADLDLDGKPELVVVAGGFVRVQDPQTGVVLTQLDMPGNGSGGPPTVAQFDGKGGPEFASANGTSYAVFHYEPLPTPTITVVWSKTTQDLSSNRTGSTVFDFEGDGSAEVIYNDECYMRIYAGTTGDVLFEIPSSSATIHEYPVVVDVDADNNTEIVVVANDLNHLGGSPSCPYGVAGARHGVFVYGDAKDRWVRTRRVWNQHAYHVTNVDPSGAIPSPELASWGPKGFDNYRQSTQGKAVYNAPDLTVSLSASLSTCPAAVKVDATVKNGGSLGVPAGVVVSFYQGAQPGGTLVGTATTKGPLLPGGSEVVSVTVPVKDPSPLAFWVVVDGTSNGGGVVNECVETNNTGAVADVTCGKL